eukprot:g3146.t1
MWGVCEAVLLQNGASIVVLLIGNPILILVLTTDASMSDFEINTRKQSTLVALIMGITYLICASGGTFQTRQDFQIKYDIIMPFNETITSFQLSNRSQSNNTRPKMMSIKYQLGPYAVVRLLFYWLWALKVWFLANFDPHLCLMFQSKMRKTKSDVSALKFEYDDSGTVEMLIDEGHRKYEVDSRCDLMQCDPDTTLLVVVPIRGRTIKAGAKYSLWYKIMGCFFRYTDDHDRAVRANFIISAIQKCKLLLNSLMIGSLVTGILAQLKIAPHCVSTSSPSRRQRSSTESSSLSATEPNSPIPGVSDGFSMHSIEAFSSRPKLSFYLGNDKSYTRPNLAALTFQSTHRSTKRYADENRRKQLPASFFTTTTTNNTPSGNGTTMVVSPQTNIEVTGGGRSDTVRTSTIIQGGMSETPEKKNSKLGLTTMLTATTTLATPGLHAIHETGYSTAQSSGQASVKGGDVTIHFQDSMTQSPIMDQPYLYSPSILSAENTTTNALSNGNKTSGLDKLRSSNNNSDKGRHRAQSSESLQRKQSTHSIDSQGLDPNGLSQYRSPSSHHPHSVGYPNKGYPNKGYPNKGYPTTSSPPHGGPYYSHQPHHHSSSSSHHGSPMKNNIIDSYKNEAVNNTVPRSEATKFGMWDGVFARVLLQIFGVIMFLRLGWLVGYAGILGSILIILVSTCLTSITALSLSAICTNGTVEGGGAYFLISRTLGPKFGGVIGVLFWIANTVGVSLYLVGFAEALVEQVNGTILHNSWDTTLIATLGLIVIYAICMVGVGWVVKFQLGLLGLLIAAILSFFIGAIAGPGQQTSHNSSSGIGSSNGSTINNASSPIVVAPPSAFVGFPHANNWLPSFDANVGFGTCLAVFFPAVTGIMAGANISGDLKDPAKAIPKGTNLGIAVSTVVYILMAIFLGLSAQAETVYNLTNATTGVVIDVVRGGLKYDFLMMKEISAVEILIYAGIYAATISSALASLVGAPRILQAVARDNLFNFLRPFKEGYGPSDEPLRAYALTMVIAGLCNLLPLNGIAPLITNFFMITYAFVNYALFLSDLSRAPGWRPSFKFYNRWVALAGALACIVFMIYLNWYMGIATLVIAI